MTTSLVEFIVTQEPKYPLYVYCEQLDLKKLSRKSYLSNLTACVKIYENLWCIHKQTMLWILFKGEYYNC